MTQLKTQGVYINEVNAFPNSVVEVATADPASVGYAQKAKNGIKALLNKPFGIASIAEYLEYYGGAPQCEFNLAAITEEEKTTQPGSHKKIGNDILDGIMRVTDRIAGSIPAEFIELTFQQQKQKS